MTVAGALSPRRVLLAGRDRRFLKVTGFLLARNGFLPETCGNPDDLVQLVELYEPDVVVVDGSDALDATARSVAELEAAHPRVGVLVFAEEGERAAAGSLPKWSSLEWLAREVEAAYARASSRAGIAPGFQ